jgi:hypothetical protein
VTGETASIVEGVFDPVSPSDWNGEWPTYSRRSDPNIIIEYINRQWEVKDLGDKGKLFYCYAYLKTGLALENCASGRVSSHTLICILNEQEYMF